MESLTRSWRAAAGILLMVALSFMVFVGAQEDYESDSWSESVERSLSLSDMLPCAFRGVFLLHKQTSKVSTCLECICINGTTHCKVRCQKIYVQNVTVILDGAFIFAQEETMTVKFGLRVDVDRELATLAQGENFWKLGAWISDGSGQKYSYNENVFKEEEASKNYNSVSPLPWEWSNLEFTMTFGSDSCNNYKYFCVEFDQSDDPRPRNKIPFTFQAVKNERKRLTNCVPLIIDCSGEY